MATRPAPRHAAMTMLTRHDAADGNWDATSFSLQAPAFSFVVDRYIAPSRDEHYLHTTILFPPCRFSLRR